MPEPAKQVPHKYEVSVSAGPFREPGKDIISYDFFINRKGWLIPRVMRVYVGLKDELEFFQSTVLGVTGGSPGQQMKVTQMLTRKIAEQKIAIVLEEGRIEKAAEVLVAEFSGPDAYLFPKLEAWMQEVKGSTREDILKQAGI